jgi:hypothetical protein
MGGLSPPSRQVWMGSPWEWAATKNTNAAVGPVGVCPPHAHTFPSPLVEKISREFGSIIHSAAVKAIPDRTLM